VALRSISKICEMKKLHYMGKRGLAGTTAYNGHVCDAMVCSENNVELDVIECVKRHESFTATLPCLN